MLCTGARESHPGGNPATSKVVTGEFEKLFCWLGLKDVIENFLDPWKQLWETEKKKVVYGYFVTSSNIQFKLQILKEPPSLGFESITLIILF